MPGFDEVAHVYDATRSLRPDVMAKVVDDAGTVIAARSIVGEIVRLDVPLEGALLVNAVTDANDQKTFPPAVLPPKN